MLKLFWILAFLLLAQEAFAGSYFTGGVPPATEPLTGSEMLPADNGLAGGSEAIGVAQLLRYGQSLPLGHNLIEGGHSDTNLWQRSTIGTGITNAPLYGSADRWAAFSGTSDEIKLVRDTAAADLLPGSASVFQLVRTPAVATVATPVCVAQEIASRSLSGMQSGVLELSFDAKAGSGFGTLGNLMNAYVIAGTGVDEGIAGLAKVADSSLGGTAWTGASVLTQGVLALGASQVRYVAVAQMPASATELGIALCYTPAASTALPGDYIAFDNVQLRENPSLGTYVNASAGYLASKLPASAYAAKTAQAEAEAQYRYFYELKDNLPTTARFGTCQGASATQAFCSVELPEAMRVAPAVTVAVPSSFSITTPAQVSQACTALAGVTGGSTAQLGQLSCTSAGLAAGGAYTFGSWNTGAGSYVSFSADF